MTQNNTKLNQTIEKRPPKEGAQSGWRFLMPDDDGVGDTGRQRSPLSKPKKSFRPTEVAAQNARYLQADQESYPTSLSCFNCILKNIFCQGVKYGSIVGVFAIILILGTVFVPYKIATAQVSIPPSLILLELDAGTPDWLFVKNDNSVPVISNLTATLINPTTLRVSWKTDVPSTSLVEYGTAEQYQSDRYPFQNYVEDQTYVTNHVITLTNLLPSLTYYYQVRSNQYEILETISPVQIININPTVAPDTKSGTTNPVVPGTTDGGSIKLPVDRVNATKKSLGPKDVIPVTTSPVSTGNSGLIPCGVDPLTPGADPTTTHPCGFADFIKLITNITNFLIILGAAVSTLAFAYAGFLMMTASGEMGKIEEAKAIFGKVVVGFLFMLAAWLIVHAIESAFIAPSSGINSFLQSGTQSDTTPPITAPAPNPPAGTINVF